MTYLVPSQPGRGWGVLSLIAAALPLPFLFALNILALVIANQDRPGGENIVFGIFAGIGLVLFPILLILTVWFGVLAVIRPNRSGRTMGIIALSIAVVQIVLIVFGYQPWIG